MRLLVCGGRDYNDRAKVWEVLDAVARYNQITVLIHGAAPGADTLAGEWAKEHGIPVTARPAEWAKYGRAAAGRLRNRQMLVDDKPTYVVAFPGGHGTADMVRRAEAAGIAIERIKQ